MKFLIIILLFFTACSRTNNETQTEETSHTSKGKERDGRAGRDDKDIRAEREEQRRQIEVVDKNKNFSIISFENNDAKHSSINIFIRGRRSAKFDLDDLPACIALRKSDLANLRLEVIAPETTTAGIPSNFHPLEKCSCDNNNPEIKNCTTEFKDYKFTISGFAIPFVFTNLWCTMEVQTEQIPDASNCQRF